MLSLLKKDLVLNQRQFIGVSLIILITSFSFPTAHFYIFFSCILTSNLFMSDSKNHVNRFLQSLPVSKSLIVKSRFIYILLETTFFILLLWGINAVAFYGNASKFPWEQIYLYTLNDILFVFGIVLIIQAISIPLYYKFDSVLLVNSMQGIVGAIFLITILFGVRAAKANFEGEHFFASQMTKGLMEWLRSPVPFSPVVLFVCSLILFFVSMKGSKELLKNTTRMD
ncbi:ABC-2 transporter permease [Aquibacillus saliphilus]|uniref:ABC-2 transporter permease n=1 Tax=Aquibacillus saliphilus TaxID=1909422 RepID=UPI001CF02818|nr:ABC-2 transporter permease [Aquibacillus saliphilus]